jgi:glycosyltransferase involved in cell wall biosynthesis
VSAFASRVSPFASGRSVRYNPAHFMTAADAPRFCIVTPSYNTGRYIGPCIDSVLSQRPPASGPAFEVDYVVMDGGSTDGTVDVLRSYGDRLRWVSEKDKGQSDAIDRGFAKVGRGRPDDVLGWLNSDDTYAPGAFAAAAAVFARHPHADIVYGGATYTDVRGKHISYCTHIEPYDRDRLLYYSDFIVQPTTFFRRRALDAVGGINVNLHWIMDYELWVRMAQHGCRFVYTPTVLANFRWLSDNKTATGGMRRLDEIERTLAGLGLPMPAYNQLERCNLLAKLALTAAGRGRLGEAARAVRQIVAKLATSPRAFRSLFEVFTWQIIWTGQVLRARAAAADRRRDAADSRKRARGVARVGG